MLSRAFGIYKLLIQVDENRSQPEEDVICRNPQASEENSASYKR
jgi:hypothetical protein